MKIVNFSTTNAQIQDEIINVANSNPINLNHDLFYNKSGKLVVISTGAGGTGTVLVESTDYDIGDAFPDSSLPASISPDVAYTTVAIINASYHNIDLYVAYYPISDVISASRWNTDLTYQFLALSDDYTITDEYSKLFITFTRQVSSKTITLPDATDERWAGNEIVIKVIGSGAGNVALATTSGQTIGDITASSWEWDGVGTLRIVSNGSNYDVLDNGIWDAGSVADSGSDKGREFIKFVTGELKQTGYYDPGTYDITTSFGSLYRSAEYTITFGLTFVTIKFIGNPSVDANSMFTSIIYNLQTANSKFIAIASSSLASQTGDYYYSAIGSWV
jgi:hypothetical protein